MSCFCPRIPSRIAHTFSPLISLGDPFAVTISHIFLLLMTLTVFRSTGQEFCAESLNLGLSRFVFFTINSGLGEEDHSGYDLWLPMLTLITWLRCYISDFSTAYVLRHFSRVWLFFNPMDCILPGSSVHGILQARILEWVAISFSRGFSWYRDRTSLSEGLLHWQAGSLPQAPPGKPTAVLLFFPLSILYTLKN